MNPRSEAAWVKFREQLAELGAICLEEAWLGGRAQHRIRCREGHETSVHPSTLHQGGGACKVCSGVDSAAAWQAFRDTVERLGGTVLDAQWRGSTTRLLVRCAEGHENMIHPGTVQQGGGICKTCAGLNPAAAEARFRAFLAERGATLLEEKWLGVNKPHRVRCAAGHESAPTPGNVRRRNGFCPQCAGNYRGKGSEEFFAHLAGLGATIIDTAWKGGGQPHRCICPNGHDCYPRPNMIKRLRGICPTCAGQNMDEAAERFLARLAAVGAKLGEPAYRGANKPHRVICSEGHECWTWPTALQQGGGICRICSHKAFDAFYVVTDREEGRVKFGITSGDGQKRLKQHWRNGYGTLEFLLTGMQGSSAPELERRVMSTLRLAEIDPLHGREYFDISALAVILDVAGGYADRAEAA